MIFLDAKDDFKKINSNPSKYDYYEINKKLNSDDSYKKEFINEIENFIVDNKLNIPKQSYINSKLDNIKNESSNIDHEELIKFDENFSQKYGKKLSTKNDLSETEFDRFRSAADDFIKTDNYNNEKMRDNLEYMIEFMSKNPKEFNYFSERFFDEGIKENRLPEKFNRFSNDINKLIKNFQLSVVSKVKTVINTTKDLKVRSSLTKSLTSFRQDQFRKELEEVKKYNSLRENQSHKKTYKQSITV